MPMLLNAASGTTSIPLNAIITASAEKKTVRLAVAPADAAQILRSVTPDVVLIDARAGVGGEGVIGSLKQDCPATKVIVLAVYSSDTDEALKSGADRVVMKDSGRRLLLDAVRAVTND